MCRLAPIVAALLALTLTGSWWGVPRPLNPRDLHSATIFAWAHANADNVTLNSGNITNWLSSDTALANATNQWTANGSTNRPAFTSGAAALATFNGTANALEMNVTGPGALTLLVRFRLTSTPGASTFFSIVSIKNGSSTLFFELLAVNNAGYKKLTWVGVASGSATVGIDPTLDTSAHYLLITWNGNTHTTTTNYTCDLDGASQTVLTSGAVGRTGSDLGSLGGRVDSAHAVTFPTPVEIKDVIIYTGQASAIDRAWLNNWASRQP